jgi:MFS transporter, ACS family, glucarate transporter
VAALPADAAATPEQRAQLAAALNEWLKQPDLLTGLDLTPIRGELTEKMLAWFEPTGPPRSADQIARDHRLLLEFLFSGSIRQLHGDAWQPVLMIYGAVGVVMAFVFFAFYRDSPRQHFLCNQAEADLADAHELAGGDGTPVSGRTLWIGILTSVGLWASSLVQFGTNFGWIFLGSMLPTYLQRVYPKVSLIERGWMAMLPFLVAVPMMIFGGWWTDRLARRYGTYWGRCVPIASTRFLAAAAFLACCFLDSPWAITFVLCAFSIASDSGVPAIWAYNLDVGKRNVGLVLGWGNMWGNPGAAVAPTILGDFVLPRFVDFDGSFTIEEAHAGYNAVFATCAAVFVFIGIVAFFIDASRPIGAKASRAA